MTLFLLKTTLSCGFKHELLSKDVRALQVLLTELLRDGGSGFIWRVG